MVEFALYAVGVVVALKLGTTLVVWSRVMGLRFRDSRVMLTARENVAPEIAPIFAEAQQLLDGLGFQFSHAQWSEPPGATESPRPYEIFLHAETLTYASVCPSVLYNGVRVFDVLFTTHFDDGATVVTGDSIEHLIPAMPPGWDFRDEYVNDVEEQWRIHQEAVADRTAILDPVLLTPEEFAVGLEADLTAAFTVLEEAGRVVRDASSGQRKLSPVEAFRVAKRVQSGSRRVSVNGRERAITGGVNAGGAAQVAADIYAFVRNEALEGSRTQSRRLKMGLFVVSMVGFVLAFGWIWSWRTVPILLLVVLIHELGHLAGMALFGYRDRQIFFVPFLGAAAMGRNDDATPLQKVIIYLLGPIPGIAIGFACLRIGAATGGWFWNELATIAIVINYLNLLPLAPLDGGRVVETLLLSRFPRAQALFLLASTTLFGVGAVLALDPILGILAAFMALSVPAKWKWGGAAGRISRTLPDGAGKREKLHAIFETLNGSRFDKLPSSGRLQMAKGLLSYLQERRPGLGVSLGGAMLYAAALIAPLMGYAGYLDSLPESDFVDAGAPPGIEQPAEQEPEDDPQDLRTALDLDLL